MLLTRNFSLLHRKFFTFFISVAPTITSDTLSNHDVLNEGESLQINCLVESFPAPMSYWVKESPLQNRRNEVIQRVLEQR